MCDSHIMSVPEFNNPYSYQEKRLPYSQSAIQFIKTISRLNINSLLVDIACGTGLLLQEFGNTGKIIGIDQSLPMLEFARTSHGGKSSGFIQGDAHSMPLKSDSVDLLLVGHAIHWFQLDPFLKEAFRILKPGGWLATISRYPSPKEPYRPLYTYLLHKWAEKNIDAPPKLLNLEDVGIGYITSMANYGFANYQRMVFEELVSIDIEEYMNRGEDSPLYQSMTSEQRSLYKVELRAAIKTNTHTDHISEINYDYVSVAQKGDG